AASTLPFGNLLNALNKRLHLLERGIAAFGAAPLAMRLMARKKTRPEAGRSAGTNCDRNRFLQGEGSTHRGVCSMCDYSLHAIDSRPARVGDSLVTTAFQNTWTRGFAAVTEPAVAACLLPGTELAFESEVDWDRLFKFFRRNSKYGKVVRF